MAHGDLRSQHSFGTTLRFILSNCANELSAVNAIGTLLFRKMNSGLIRWRVMTVSNKQMDPAVELGRNPVSKHQI